MNVRATLQLVMVKVHARPKAQVGDMEHITVTVADPIIFDMLAPLVARLTSGTASRRDHETLLALLTHNAMFSGQVDETAVIVAIVDRYWRRCPKRYWPLSWSSLKFWSVRRTQPILDTEVHPDTLHAEIQGP
jgi:hypothetical protein